MSMVQPRSTGEAHDSDDVVVDDTPGGVTLLEANPARISALIQNLGDATMRVTTDGTEPTPTHGKRVVSGAALTLDGPNCSTSAVVAIQEGATSTAANASEVD